MTKYVVILLCLMSVPLWALLPGDKAPELKVTFWLDGDPGILPWTKGDRTTSAAMTDDDKSPRMFALLFYGAWAPGSAEAFKLAKSAMTGKKNVSLFAVTRDDEPRTRTFLCENNLEGTPTGLDGDGRSFAAYLRGSGMVPALFLIDQSGQLLWWGDAPDFPGALERITSGKYDADEARKVAEERLKLQLALQGARHDDVLRHAERILKLEPDNSFGLRSALFVHETRGEEDKAGALLERLIRLRPDNSRLHFVRLELLVRAGKNGQELSTAFKETATRFNHRGDTLNELAWFMLERAPYGARDPELLLNVSMRALELLSPEATAADKASRHGAMARAYAFAGYFSRAREHQETVAGLLKDDDSRQVLEIIRKQEALSRRK